MKIVETTFERLPRERLEIGFEGENLRATVRIDCASVFAEYPNATPALIVKPLFADAYPVVVDRNGTDVDWLITSEILSFNGDGEIQLIFYKDQVICKSAVSKIRVSRSLTVTGEMPDPVAQWIDDANAKLAEVDAVIVSIDEMDATAHGLPEGSAPTAEVQDVDDHKRIVLGIPAGATGATGAKGDKGDRGEVGATPQVGIGTVQTLPAGSSATASMSGTTENPLLNLGIPQGIQGVKGDRGEKGETGATGATGATPDLSIGTVTTLPAGSSATAEITGTADNPVLSLGIPQGAQGIQGEKGEKGDPGDGTPAGGLTDQVLAKASDTDRDTKWMYVAPVVKNEASGSIASFPDGADGHPIDELKVAIEPVQDLHGYDHPWPAGGGKNLFDGILEHGNLHPDNTNVLYSRCANFIPVNGNTNYTMLFADVPTMDAFTGQVYTLEYDSNKQYINNTRSARKYGLTSGSSITFTTVETAKYVRFFIYDTVEHPLTDFKKIQIEEGSTATSYEPYSNICPIAGWDGVQIVVSPTTDAEDGQTYDITLPSGAGTVYGGELTVNADGSGSLVVDRVADTLTGQENMGAVDVYYAVATSHTHPTWTAANVLCSHFAQSGTNSVASGNAPTSVWFRLDKTVADFATVEAFRSYIANQYTAGTPVTISYKLATPLSYTLTPSQIRTLLGTNNVWADAGDVSVEYNADTKLYIDNKITQAIAAALNS